MSPSMLADGKPSGGPFSSGMDTAARLVVALDAWSVITLRRCSANRAKTLTTSTASKPYADPAISRKPGARIGAR